ncbi:Aspartokinase [Rickettsiales bacterium Ac37b]|nr:Aspartokinase [Rickettsiales bacterium Ac37b]
MALILQKFGGTSVANIERINKVALRVKAEVDKGNEVVVVVSAMAGVTDQLVSLVNNISTLSKAQSWAEYDSIVSSGEQVSSGLLALALQNLGIQSRSWSGWQLPFKTDKAHSKARIEDIDVTPILNGLKEKEVAVVAGFQGISPDYRITTLGRGGSDTSAVALAAKLHAKRCDIYTDVDGIYTADPRIVNKACKLAKVSYEEMLEMASLGAKVLQTRSVEMAMKHHVPLCVLSSFNDIPGTFVVDEDKDMEKKLITAVTYSRNEAMVVLRGMPDQLQISAAIFGPLADANINVDMIVKNVSENGDKSDITFTVPREDLHNTEQLLYQESGSIKFESLTAYANIAKVSIIGVGMRSHSGVAKQMFQVLADKGINIIVISTSEIKISVLIKEEYMELALRSLHTAFELDREENLEV